MESRPEWIENLVNRVSAMVRSHEEVPLGCHLHQTEDCWEISVFTMRVEVLGGPRDGEELTLPFHVDLSQIGEVLDEVESLTWQTTRIGSSDDVGPHLSLLGRCDGNEVWVRLLAEAPATTPCAGRFCLQTLELHSN